jgi:hypothetical protein
MLDPSSSPSATTSPKSVSNSVLSPEKSNTGGFFEPGLSTMVGRKAAVMFSPTAESLSEPLDSVILVQRLEASLDKRFINLFALEVGVSVHRASSTRFKIER